MSMLRALKMCRFSEIVYNNSDIATQQLSTDGYSYNRWFGNQDTQGFVAFNPDINELVICFRGLPILNVKTFFKYTNLIQKKTINIGRVHYKFYNSFHIVSEDIVNYISTLPIDSNTFIVCTGHSLGAAIATIAAEKLNAHELYTFGSPRVGNRTFVNCLHRKNIKHYRFVNNNDIITVLPFAFLGYAHFEKAIYFNYYGKIRQPNLWQRIKDRTRGSLRASIKYEVYNNLFDHGIRKYYHKVKNNVGT